MFASERKPMIGLTIISRAVIFLLLVAAFHTSAATNESLLIFEAEDFQVGHSAWKRRAYGENYYAGAFANTFLSRKAFLGAPEKGPRSTATFRALIPSAGRYLALD